MQALRVVTQDVCVEQIVDLLLAALYYTLMLYQGIQCSIDGVPDMFPR